MTQERRGTGGREGVWGRRAVEAAVGCLRASHSWTRPLHMQPYAHPFPQATWISWGLDFQGSLN